MASKLDSSTTAILDLPASWIGVLGGSGGVFVSFLWAFAEGTLFFVVPDVFLSLVAVLAPRRAWRHILSAVLGAVCAGTFMFAWDANNPAQAHAIVAKVPFIPRRMFDEVKSGYERRGIAAVFLGPLSGIPYKIYAIEAPGRFGLAEFAAATAPARAWRFALVCLLSGTAAHFLRLRWQTSQKQLTTLYGIAWVLFYAFYWGRIIWK